MVRACTGWAACLLALMGCIPALPQEPVERALVRDIARVIDVKARTGWLDDETEIRNTLPDAMKSVCLVPESNRRFTLGWIDRQIALRGGDVAAVWRERGRDLDEVADLVLFARMRSLTARADEWARLGRCPFWLESSPRFRGVHFHAERLILSVEGGGRFLGEFKRDGNRYGAGGSGRLLVGWGFSGDWALLLGPEFGGDARFSDLHLGNQEQQLPQLAAFGALPLVLRWDFGLSTYAEAEAGALMFIDKATTADNLGNITAQSVFGFRSGLAFGGTFLRVQQGLISKLAFAVTFEVLPAINAIQIGFGLRTGFDYSSWKSF